MCSIIDVFSISISLGKPKGGHKGRMKHYLTAEEIADQEERRKREQDWKVYTFIMLHLFGVI